MARYRAPDPSPWWLKVARLDYYAHRNDRAWWTMCDRIRSTSSGDEFFYRVRDLPGNVANNYRVPWTIRLTKPRPMPVKRSGSSAGRYGY